MVRVNEDRSKYRWNLALGGVWLLRCSYSCMSFVLMRVRLRDAVVLLNIVCVYVMTCTCIDTWVYFVYLCESDEYVCINLYVLCLYAFATYEPCV